HILVPDPHLAEDRQHGSGDLFRIVRVSGDVDLPALHWVAPALVPYECGQELRVGGRREVDGTWLDVGKRLIHGQAGDLDGRAGRQGVTAGTWHDFPPSSNWVSQGAVAAGAGGAQPPLVGSGPGAQAGVRPSPWAVPANLPCFLTRENGSNIHRT